MRACLALCAVSALVGAALADCTACISGQCYRKHATGERGLLLDIDRKTNILYSQNEDTFMQCQLDTGRCNTTTRTQNILELAVDQHTGDTYGAFHDIEGIYKLDLVNNDDQLLVTNNVRNLMFKDKLYYKPYWVYGIFSYEDGESRVVAGTDDYHVRDFLVDKNDDIYFETDWMGKFFIKWLSKGVVKQNVLWRDGYLMSVDMNGNAVLIHLDSHAVYIATDGQVTEIGVINDGINENGINIRPLFDRDNNIIYHNDTTGSIFHLKRDAGSSCTYSILENKAIITEVAVNTTSYNIKTTTSSSHGGDTGGNDGMSPSTSASSAGSAPDGSGATCSAARGHQAHTEREQQSSCRCEGPRIPTITINVEFN